MSQSIIANRLRKYTIDKFKDSYCSDWWEGVPDESYKFFDFDLTPLMELPNGTASFVGSAIGSARTQSVKCPEGKVTVEFKFTNVTSLKSFLLHALPEKYNVTTPGAP